MDALLHGIQALVTAITSLVPVWTQTAQAVHDQSAAIATQPKLKPKQPSSFEPLTEINNASTPSSMNSASTSLP